MCGRTACSLDPGTLRQKCGYRCKRTGKWKRALWRSAPNGAKYYPSHNICPSNTAPVVIARNHVQDSEFDVAEEESDRVIQPMKWGLIPSWQKDGSSSSTFKMNNARSDGLTSKPVFRNPLQKGRRCVVVSEGYYEWKSSDGKKQPYYIYMKKQSPSSSNCDPEENEATPNAFKAEDAIDVTVTNMVNDAQQLQKCDTMPVVEGSSADDDQPLVTMAGLFDIVPCPDGEGDLYSYSIITVDADPSVNWIHHRMPAILATQDEVDAWLDYENIPLKEALKLIRPVDALTQHPVSASAVGNVKNKSSECIEKIDPKKSPVKRSASSMLMSAWLQKGSAKKPRN